MVCTLAWQSSWSCAHIVAWHDVVPQCLSWRYYGNGGVSQLSCTTWSCRGLRHHLLIIRGCHTRVDSSPQIIDRLAACGVGGHDPELRGHDLCWFGWPLSQGHRHGSHLVVGGVVRTSRRTVLGRWFSVLAFIARRCCFVSAVWRRDGV